MPLLLPALLAAAPVNADPQSAQSVGWILLGLAALATAANQILGLFERFRAMRAPDPGSVSPDKVQSLEARVRGLELKMENVMGRIDSKFESISQTLTNLQSDWNYAIGKIDGRSESDRG